jgi:hypothetical protein
LRINFTKETVQLCNKIPTTGGKRIIHTNLTVCILPGEIKKVTLVIVFLLDGYVRYINGIQPDGEFTKIEVLL